MSSDIHVQGSGNQHLPEHQIGRIPNREISLSGDSKTHSVDLGPAGRSLVGKTQHNGPLELTRFRGRFPSLPIWKRDDGFQNERS